MQVRGKAQKRLRRKSVPFCKLVRNECDEHEGAQNHKRHANALRLAGAFLNMVPRSFKAMPMIRLIEHYAAQAKEDDDSQNVSK
jgi:hypothetical protein